jgi:hypothetical protein
VYLKIEWIRELAKSKGILLWQIADKLRITDGNFSRRLRYEMTPEEQESIRAIINELTEEQR